MNDNVKESLKLADEEEADRLVDPAANLDRREVLTRLGLGASFAYATPVLLTLSKAWADSSDDDDDDASDGDDDASEGDDDDDADDDDDDDADDDDADDDDADDDDDDEPSEPTVPPT